MTWYYRCETKGIQHWILDSSRLRDLVGGSALVEALTSEAERGVADAGGEIVFAAAGGLLATFPDREKLEAFASEWPMYVAYHAPGLQLVQAWVDGGDSEDPVNELFTRLLPARRNLVNPPLVEAGPLLERAGRSGLPAVPHPTDLHRSKARQTTWDEAAVEKERAKQSRGEQDEIFGGALTLKEIDEDVERWPEGPIAVIHADGSGVGSRLTKIGTDPKRLEEFSQALAEATKAATRTAVDVLRNQGGGRLRIRPVVLGGDDLTAILRAGDALVFTETWLREFERETKARAGELGKRGLHAGAGIALVNRGYPFSMAYETAEAACKAAKDDVLEDQSPASSALRFQRITTALTDETEMGATWALDGIESLKMLVVAVKKLPRGTLRSWLGLVDAGADRSGERDALWARAGEVADGESWNAFQAALEAVGADPESGMFTPPRTDTPLRDALVLAHFGNMRAQRETETREKEARS